MVFRPIKNIDAHIVSWTKKDVSKPKKNRLAPKKHGIFSQQIMDFPGLSWIFAKWGPLDS